MGQCKPPSPPRDVSDPQASNLAYDEIEREKAEIIRQLEEHKRMEMNLLKQQASASAHVQRPDYVVPHQPATKLSSSSRRLGPKESAAKSSFAKQHEAMEEADCALCGRRAPCATGTCFCSQCSARMELLGPSSPEVAALNNRVSPQSRSSSADSIKSWSPNLGAQLGSSFAQGEMSGCVLCGSRFVCDPDAQSSVLCPRCL